MSHPITRSTGLMHWHTVFHVEPLYKLKELVPDEVVVIHRQHEAGGVDFLHALAVVDEEGVVEHVLDREAAGIGAPVVHDVSLRGEVGAGGHLLDQVGVWAGVFVARDVFAGHLFPVDGADKP